MRLFIDECMSPKLVTAIFKLGHYAEHPRNMGGLRALDHEVLARCVDNDLIVVTHNARDFRKLVGRTEVHPGLIVVEEAEFDTSFLLLSAVIEHITSACGTEDPASYMVNRVIEIDITGKIRVYSLPL
jgi:predicted nuclease of predicted toxin-antitoxin system